MWEEEGLRDITIKGETTKDYKFEKLGEYLGYPPIATKWFENTTRQTKGDFRGIGKVKIYYHGLTFVCRKKDVEECLTWLDKYRKVPEHLQTGIRKLVI